MIGKEVRTGPTPAGGVRSEAYYFDLDDNLCNKTVAAKVIIIEFDDNNTKILETLGFINPKE